MEQFVITFNQIDNGNSLNYGYETILGKNAKDALQRRFNKPFNRAYGEAGRYADIIIVKGVYSAETRSIKCNSTKYTQLCFAVQ